MKKINVDLNSSSYSIVIDNQYSHILDNMVFIGENTKIIIITDDNVKELYLDKLIHDLNHNVDSIFCFTISHGETSKNLHVVTQIYDYLFEIHADRSDVILALGGGVVGDIAGYAAATFLRGISFVQIPTTLLAQVDSSIGGKTGINYNGIKNAIGVFYQPRLVYINTQVLKTLPLCEFLNGITEIIVHAIISSPILISYILENLKSIVEVNDQILEPLIYENCSIKASFIQKDEKDKGIRKMLNFGHTIGHAIESAYEYKYSHGECVSIGIVSAFKIAAYKKLITMDTVDYIKNVLREIGLPVYIENIDWQKVINIIYYDKKSIGGKLSFILPTEIGSVLEYRIDADTPFISILSNE